MGPGRAIAARAGYLDASALVKLLVREPESAALGQALDAEERLVASEVLAVEAACVGHRRGIPVARVQAAVARVGLLPLSASVLRRTAQPFSRPLRALDAIHLATALETEDATVLFGYHAELLAAAAAEGLEVVAPGAGA